MNAKVVISVNVKPDFVVRTVMTKSVYAIQALAIAVLNVLIRYVRL